MDLTPLIDLPLNGDLKTETWPDTVTSPDSHDPNGTDDSVVALLRHLLSRRWPGLHMQTIANAAETPSPAIQFLIGCQDGSRKVMVAPGIDPIGVIRLFEDDGTNDFQFEPKETGAVTFRQLLDDPYGALDLNEHPNCNRIQVAFP